MEKLRFGTKEIIATVAGTAFFVFAEWLENCIIQAGMIPPLMYEWVQLRVLVVTIVAAFFGPMSGMLCGICGDLLINAVYESVISYPEVIVLGLFGLIVGLYFCRLHFDPSVFSRRVFMDFNAIQIAAAILCSIFVAPLLRFFLENKDLSRSVSVGAKSAVGNSLISGIICPILMAVVAAVLGRKKRGNTRTT